MRGLRLSRSEEISLIYCESRLRPWTRLASAWSQTLVGHSAEMNQTPTALMTDPVYTFEMPDFEVQSLLLVWNHQAICEEGSVVLDRLNYLFCL